MLDVTRLIVQIGAILIAARLVGYVFRRIHQTQVMGEMVAGILLGPSFLGWLAPDAYAFLFPKESFPLLGALSQVGLILYMFLVGASLDSKQLRERAQSAIVTSHASIVVPFLLGLLLAGYLYPRLSGESVPYIHFALFLGISMSITAFPVLARILTDRKLSRTGVGAVALACAAVDDVTAWCLLAGLILFVRASGTSLSVWGTIAGTAAYVGAMLFLVRPIFAWLMSRHRHRMNGGVPQDLLAGILLAVLASAWITEQLGIHALFGAFLVGVVMPREEGLVPSLTEKLEDVTVVFLLPLFFALTGLRTSVSLLNGGAMWGYCALVIVVAVAGKLGGAMVASKLTGMSWRDAGAIGILMNTRGLMELVVLNIGLDLGIVSPSLFAMLVLMALATTFATTPLLDWFYLERLRRESPVSSAALYARRIP